MPRGVIATRRLEGSLSWRRTSKTPCICIKKNDTWEWKNINELSKENFEKYREQISEGINKLQCKTSETAVHIKYKYIPSPTEYELMKRLFNYLPNKHKRNFMIEFSNTKLGTNVCANCLGFAIEKKKCVHHDCAGLCEGCYEFLHDMCPLCKKAQIVKCPICREDKKKTEVILLKNCHHPICHKCFAHSAEAKSLIKKCPICRNEEIF